MSNVTSAAPKAPPLKAVIIPVTPLQQNCTLFWCTETNKAALVDPGGDLDKLKAAVAQTGVELEKLLVTHGHLDHCGQTGMLAKELGLPIEGRMKKTASGLQSSTMMAHAGVWKRIRSNQIAGWWMATRSPWAT
jgi:glyoxylase-like metal-dependent hydrolase (beta-lactamase superfamily II)